MGKETGYRIGAIVGKVEEVDVNDNGVGWGEFLRVRIVLDLSKPLSQGRLLKLKEKSIWVAFQCEKIPKFCFNCGVIRHGNKGCEKLGSRLFQGTEKEPQFGTWLRATSPERRYGNGGTWGRGVKRRPITEECSH